MPTARQVIPRIPSGFNFPQDCGFSTVWQRNCPIIGHVLILALDTSSPSGSIAVLRDQEVLGTISASTDEIYSSRMFRHLEFLLRELSVSLDQFDLFAVASGPGSFTGLRVGLAAVKGWAEVYRKPVAAISGLEAVAAQSHTPASLVVPVLDARRSQIYFALYRRAGVASNVCFALDGEEFVATIEEFREALQARTSGQHFVVVTPVPDLLSRLASGIETPAAHPHPLAIERVSNILAPQVGLLGYQRALRGATSDAISLDANYIRRSDAELHLKEPAAS
jgi:tRNA threonylcarbamoyladenosine biosynthesis protein TsaB